MRIVFVFSINWSEAGSSRDMGARWSVLCHICRHISTELCCGSGLEKRDILSLLNSVNFLRNILYRRVASSSFEQLLGHSLSELIMW